MWKSPRCNVVGFRAYRMIERDIRRNLFMIQKSIFHVSVIATVLLIPLVADAEQGREMLARGDFESGVSDWILWHCKGAGAVGVVYSSSDDIRPGSTGKRSLQIETRDEFACTNFIRKQVFGLEGGKKYRMSIWYKIVAGGEPDGPIESVIARDMKNDTNQDRKDLYVDMTVDGKWKYVSGEFTAEESTTPEDYYTMIVSVQTRGRGGKGGVIRVDDFSLWDFNPKPAAVDSAVAEAMEKAQVMEDARLAKLMAGADPNAKQSAGVEAGMLDGYPYLRNEKVMFLWSRGESGGGMLRVHDSASKKELLRIDESKATSWKVDVKRANGERLSYTNVGVPCEVKAAVQHGECRLFFKWSVADLQVIVVARLKDGESLARLRIQVKAKGNETGLVTVTHPLVSGILPLTEGAAEDQILHTRSMGDVAESPLLEGVPVGFLYPGGSMQFTALLGNERGFYCAAEDGEANRKNFDWTPDAERKTLAISISHPVLNWGAEKMVLEYRSPGDLVVGPFQGDWFDAGRIYRKWALTAPWCKKGPIHARADYPKWALNLAYWSNNRMNDEAEIGFVDLHRDYFNLPNVILHDYGYMPGYDHHSNPEYLPPRIGSANYAALVKQLRAKDIRVVNYIIGWLWNTTLESYRTEEAEKAGLVMEQGIVPRAFVGSHDLSAAICPATKLWHKKMVGLTTTLVGKYGVSGLYFDYFTNHTEDCFNTDHGHPIAGGDYWSKAVHGLLEEVRRECQKLDPETMISAEHTAEWCIDVVDTSHTGGVSSDTPVYFAVYHGYTQVFGGVQNCSTPQTLGRWWLTGTQNGENNIMPWLATTIFGDMGPYYRKLLWCHAQFGRPYLGYGEMLRRPKIEGELPILPGSACGQYQAAFPVPAVEGSAWRAPDGTIGLFFLNYDKKQHKFTWTKDLNEIVGIGADKKLKVSRWTPSGEKIVGEWSGGVLTKNMTIDSWGLIALKLEVVP